MVSEDQGAERQLGRDVVVASGSERRPSILETDQGWASQTGQKQEFSPDFLRLRLYKATERFGCGKWRIKDDLVDLAYNIVIDKIISFKAEKPFNCLAYGCKVLLNLIRSGPKSVGLARDRVTSLLNDSVRIEIEPSIPSGWHGTSGRVQLCSIPEIILNSLSKQEQIALKSIKEAGSMAEAARKAGMTRRDLRIRMDRAARKIARFFAVSNECRGVFARGFVWTTLPSPPAREGEEKGE